MEVTDNEIIQLVRSKKRAGAEALYDIYSKSLFLAIIRIIPEKEPAEEVLLQTYIRTWNSFEEYNTASCTLLAWMMRTARELAKERSAVKVITTV
ncbi:hypothetical protein [Mucilaginibacter sp.]|uniref:hypothetical protein n=1 Tax=Mucilaginibacter sp. TaxID=1882438 RepID=UPI0025D14129|nr:hypothetical protein [Mucilaginibacter sp.]